MERSKLQAIRDEAIDKIDAWLERHKLERVDMYDIDPGSSPILQEDAYDSNNTFTLDSIQKKTIHNPQSKVSIITVLLFDGSSCFDNYTWTEDTISTDALINIAEYLKDNEDFEE